jgi:PIN domain
MHFAPTRRSTRFAARGWYRSYPATLRLPYLPWRSPPSFGSPQISAPTRHRGPEDAFRFCDYLGAHPNCQMIVPGERHWEIFKRLCIAPDTRGSRVTDAWFAALAIEWGCEWITFDRDFARFPGLRWQVPVPPGG